MVWFIRKKYYSRVLDNIKSLLANTNDCHQVIAYLHSVCLLDWGIELDPESEEAIYYKNNSEWKIFEVNLLEVSR